jgi:hypothetical protein
MGFLDWFRQRKAKNDSAPASHAVSLPGIGDDAALDRLLARIEEELRSSRALPLRRLRRKHELGSTVIAWSYTSGPGKDLETKAAERLLSERLAEIGLGLDGSPLHTSDDDGSSLTFWNIGHPKFAETPPRFVEPIQRIEALDSDAQKQEAKRLATRGKFDLLAAWLCEARYSGIPASALRESQDDRAGAAVIELLKSAYADIRQRAARALGPLGGEDAVRALSAWLASARDEDTPAIASALSRLRSANAVEPLTQALQRVSESYHRVSVAQALARCGGQQGFDVLIEGVRKGGNSAEEYVSALIALDDARAAPALTDHLEKLQMGGAGESVQKNVKEFLTRHGKPPAPPVAATDVKEEPTALGFSAKPAVWSVQPPVLKLKEAIRNTWHVDLRAFELSESQAATVTSRAPIATKEWVVDGQYQIELSRNSIFVHAYGAWLDVGYVIFLYRGNVYYVNVAPGVDLTRFLYDRTDDVSHMAKIAIALAGHIGMHERGRLLIQLDGELAQSGV